jgi:hypothetical protein
VGAAQGQVRQPHRKVIPMMTQRNDGDISGG